MGGFETRQRWRDAEVASLVVSEASSVAAMTREREMEEVWEDIRQQLKKLPSAKIDSLTLFRAPSTVYTAYLLLYRIIALYLSTTRLQLDWLLTAMRHSTDQPLLTPLAEANVVWRHTGNTSSSLRGKTNRQQQQQPQRTFFTIRHVTRENLR